MTALGLDLTDDTVVNSEYTDAVNEMLGITLTRFMTPWMYVDSIFQRSDLKERQDKCIGILHNASEKVWSYFCNSRNVKQIYATVKGYRRSFVGTGRTVKKKKLWFALR